MIFAYLSSALLIPTVFGDWASTFPSIIPSNYQDWWTIETTPLGMGKNGDELYVLAQVDGKVAGAETGGIQLAKFGSQGQVAGPSQMMEFSVVGGHPGGRWATPGAFAVDGGDVLTPGYWNLSTTLDFGVLNFNKDTLKMQPDQSAVLAKMVDTAQDFPETTVALQTDARGRRWVLTQKSWPVNGNGVTLNVFGSQAALVQKQTSKQMDIAIPDLYNLASFAHDETNARFWILASTLTGKDFKTTLVKIDYTQELALTVTSFNVQSGPFDTASDWPLLALDSGDVFLTFQSVEPCNKCPFQNRAAVVRRYGVDGVEKWSRTLKDVKVNIIVVSGNIVLAGWQGLDAGTGQDVVLPALPVSTAPWPLNPVGRKLARDTVYREVSAIIADVPGVVYVAVKNSAYVTDKPRGWLTVAKMTLKSQSFCKSGVYAITQPALPSQTVQACEAVGSYYRPATQTDCHNGTNCGNYAITKALEQCFQKHAYGMTRYWFMTPTSIWDQEKNSSKDFPAPVICKVPSKKQ
jgi:hypothetical protein